MGLTTGTVGVVCGRQKKRFAPGVLVSEEAVDFEPPMAARLRERLNILLIPFCGTASSEFCSCLLHALHWRNRR